MRPCWRDSPATSAVHCSFRVNHVQVPKCLGHLSGQWCPGSYIVGFKLETDTAMLKTKALASLSKYKLQTVVANMLQNYKDVVYLYEQGKDDAVTVSRSEGSDMEAALVPALAARHGRFRAEQPSV